MFDLKTSEILFKKVIKFVFIIQTFNQVHGGEKILFSLSFCFFP